MRYRSALAVTACLFLTPASAATYSFSFDGSADNPGVVSGLIEGLLDDGVGQKPTSLIITSVAGSAFDFSSIYGINFAVPRIAEPEQYVFYDSVQRFDVENGVIGLAEFAIFAQGLGSTGPNPFLKDYVNYLCFFSASSAQKQCPGYLAFGKYTTYPDFIFAQVLRAPADGPSVTFTRVPDEPSPVPLPASVGLLAASLAFIGVVSRLGLFARRRKFV